MAEHKIIVIGASAGGVEATVQLVECLPADFPASLFVALHFPAYSTSLLPQILSRAGALPAVHPHNEDAICPGKIYVAPPNYHLLVHRNHIALSLGPRENGHRPAIDTLFRSAAQSHGHSTIGVILSGTLDDGTAGLMSIHSQGGVTIVQDPNEALFNGMPCSAIENAKVDHVLKISEIALLLIQLANDPVEEATEEDKDMTPDEINLESEIVAQNKAELEQGKHPGNASTLTCPDCGGVLWELRDGDLVRFRCHVGHAYSLDSLLSEQAADLERALWSATRALEEKAALLRRMATHAHQQNLSRSEAQFLERARDAAQSAVLMRQMIAQQVQTKQHNGGTNIEQHLNLIQPGESSEL